MEKNNWKIIFVRITCWYGAILDLIIAIAFTIYVLSPSDTFINMIFGFSTITEMNYALIAMENALMFGWTVLLIWVDRKPIERRAVLAITVFPGAGGILFFNTIGIILGNPFIPIYSVIIGSITVLLFLISFIFAHHEAKKNMNEKVKVP